MSMQTSEDYGLTHRQLAEELKQNSEQAYLKLYNYARECIEANNRADVSSLFAVLRATDGYAYSILDAILPKKMEEMKPPIDKDLSDTGKKLKQEINALKNEIRKRNEDSGIDELLDEKRAIELKINTRQKEITEIKDMISKIKWISDE